MKKIIIFTFAILFVQSSFAQIQSDNRIKITFSEISEGIKNVYSVYAINISQQSSFHQGIIKRGVLKLHHKSTILPNDRELLVHRMAEEIPIFYQCQDCFPKITGIELKSDKLLVFTGMSGPDSLIIFQWENGNFVQMGKIKTTQPVIMGKNITERYPVPIN